MQRTISVMVGKGSVKHNSRAFHAANTDPERSGLNTSYCNDDIRQVYRDLFGEALGRYNARQTRTDRMIDDYYEKIHSSKQEKPFHEIILQIGNCDDMDAKTANGELAAAILDEYMRAFESRNPNLRVFSAHHHMDEATPHLHIDFVPFTTGSKRGLDTRVSLKQALAAQGFKGGTRQETEWNQWVASEKNELAAVMECHGVKWLQKGTHEKHLSVLDYEKKMRSEEVEQLESQIDGLLADAQGVQRSADAVQARLDDLQLRAELVEVNVGKYDTDPKWQLPEPGKLMSANSYKTKIVEPFIEKLRDVVRSVVAQYLELKSKVKDLNRGLSRVCADNERLQKSLEKGKQENTKLTEIAKDYKRVRGVLGEERTDSILAKVKAEEQAQRHFKNTKSRDR